MFAQSHALVCADEFREGPVHGGIVSNHSSAVRRLAARDRVPDTAFAPPLGLRRAVTTATRAIQFFADLSVRQADMLVEWRMRDVWSGSVSWRPDRAFVLY
uniref:Uncharacterized protein n=1 Tax=Noctiluca scintillans TaxID=2966 RepID=A0A7S1APM9_NOCSC